MILIDYSCHFAHLFKDLPSGGFKSSRLIRSSSSYREPREEEKFGKREREIAQIL